MKLKREDEVMVIAGRHKGKTGKILRVLPSQQAVVVAGVNVVKRHTKPSNRQPQGGILEVTKPVPAGKVMVIDPQSGKPARIGFRQNKDGSKERIFKPSRYQIKKTKKAES